MVLGLDLAEPGPQPGHLLDGGADRAGRDVGGGVLRAAPLVDQGRHGAGQLGGVEAVPDACPQALHDEQIRLAVDPGQLPAGGRHLVVAQVAQLGEHRADPVEDPRDRVRLALDPAFEGVGLGAQPGVPFAPAQMVLALVAAVHRVPAQRRPEPTELGVVGGC